MQLRIGHGIDIHPFKAGRKLVIGGVEIEHDLGLDGHSDADALTHALIDALLGAAGFEDIGVLFPNSDLNWKDASSLKLLNIAWAKVAASGWQFVNTDISVLLENPRLKPHISAIKANLAKELSCQSGQIGVKATTAEKLGFVGRGEGIFVSAVVLLKRD